MARPQHRPPAGQNDWYRGPGSRPAPGYRTGSAGARRRQQGPRPGRSARLPGRYGVAIVAGCAALGALLTAMTGGQPGTLLGVFLIVGTLAAALAVRPGAAHVIVPVPPLAYLAAATAAGLFVMPGADMSRTGLAVSVLQWIAHGFLEMLIATGAAIALTVIRRRAMPRPARVRAR